jgi:hypothetical protein
LQEGFDSLGLLKTLRKTLAKDRKLPALLLLSLVLLLQVSFSKSIILEMFSENGVAGLLGADGFRISLLRVSVE